MVRDTRSPSHRRPPGVRRWSALGLAALALVAAPLVGRVLRALYALGSSGGPGFPSPGMIGVLAAVVLAGVGLTLGIGVLQREDRTWPVWAGTVACGLVLLFWVVFAVAEVVSPH